MSTTAASTVPEYSITDVRRMLDKIRTMWRERHTPFSIHPYLVGHSDIFTKLHGIKKTASVATKRLKTAKKEGMDTHQMADSANTSVHLQIDMPFQFVSSLPCL